MGWKSKPESSVSHCGKDQGDSREKVKWGQEGQRAPCPRRILSRIQTEFFSFICFIVIFSFESYSVALAGLELALSAQLAPKSSPSSSCLSFLSTRIKGICYHGWLQTKFYWRSEIMIIKSRSLELTCLTLSVYLRMTMNILLSPLPRAGVTGMCPTCWGDRHVSLHLFMQCWEWNPG